MVETAADRWQEPSVTVHGAEALVVISLYKLLSQLHKYLLNDTEMTGAALVEVLKTRLEPTA